MTLEDGRHVQLKGVDFSYGTGKDLKEAESKQHAHKQSREDAGLRKRGDISGLVEVQGQNPQNPSPAQSSAAASLAKIVPRTYEQVQADIDKREERFDKEKEPGVQYYFPEHAGLLRPNTYTGPEFTPEQLRGMRLDSSGEQQIRDIVKEMKAGKSFKEAMESHGSISLADKLGGTLVRDENSVLPGYKPYPKDMVDLYAERDAIGSGQLKQSLGEITDKLKASGIKDDAEIRHVLQYYALDPNKTGVGQQYLASQHTQAMVDMPPKKQVEQAYIALAAERGIPMDDADDLWRDRKTTKDAIAAVKAIHSYFYPGTEINIKGILPEPKSSPLDEVKRQAQELQKKFREAGLSQ